MADVALSQLNLGLNLRGLTAGVNMRPGEATDALDVLFREDGAVFKHWGWRRLNNAALLGVPIAMSGFTYRGKNNLVAGDTARGGNLGLADDGADFTRRSELWTSFIVLTTQRFYYWDPSTQAFVIASLPGGALVDPDPKPTIIPYNDCAYIVGWADLNLRYDPTDRRLYLWGWEAVPIAPPLALAAGGDLIADATYKYAYSYFDVYTGEESGLGAVAEITTTSANRTVSTTGLAAYSGSRHFNDLAVATDSDVGIVIYRTDADGEEFFFLATSEPGNLVAAGTDDGLFVETSVKPFQGQMRDEPKFNFAHMLKDQMYAVSWAQSAPSIAPGAVEVRLARPSFTKPSPEGQPGAYGVTNRLFFNEFDSLNSFVERWRVTDYRDLPTKEGEILTGIADTESALIVFTQRGAFEIPIVLGTTRIQRIVTRLPWHVGAVGPKAIYEVDGWIYFLSERGPYRWHPGLRIPQWIGKNLLAMFIDPTSGLCKLNPRSRLNSEIHYDIDSNTVRFSFPVGTSLTNNRQLAYWIDETSKPDAYSGWSFPSPRAQCYERAIVGPLGGSGRPPGPVEQPEKFIFGDDDGYVNEYDVSFTRGGLPQGMIASGTADATSTTTSLVSNQGGLYDQGDGLEDLRLEVVHVDGTIDVRKIASNTPTAIVPDVPFSQAPAEGALWYVAGIPALWRSWVDHMGNPHHRKTLMHLNLGYQKKFDASEAAQLDVNVGAGDFPRVSSRSRSALLNDFNEKMLISLTNLFFVYEIANTRPDEPFTLTNIERSYEVLGVKRTE